MSKRKQSEKEESIPNNLTDTITVQFLRENGAKMTSNILPFEPKLIFLHTLKLEEHLLKESEVLTRKQQTVKYQLCEKINLNEQFNSPYIIYERLNPEGNFRSVLEGRILGVSHKHEVNLSGSPRVFHFPERKEFRLNLSPIDEKEQYFAILQYEEISQSSFELYHTEVPVKFGGRGIGQIIAKEAFNQLLKKEESKLILTCTYLQHFYNKNKSDYAGKNISFA